MSRWPGDPDVRWLFRRRARFATDEGLSGADAADRPPGV